MNTGNIDIVNYRSVSIIVVTWNNSKDTIACLASLQKITYPNYHIFLVDNNSTDGSFERIKDWCVKETIQYIEYNKVVFEKGRQRDKENKLEDLHPVLKLTLIKTSKNLGYSGGINVGIKYCIKSDTDYLLILNNDTIVDERFLEPLVEFLEENENVGLVGGNLFDEDDKPTRTFGAFSNIPNLALSIFGLKTEKSFNAKQFLNKPYSVDYPCGACFMLNKSIIEYVGYMSEDYFMYFEEQDWAYRCMKAGFESYIIPKSKVIHIGGVVSAQVSMTKKMRIYYESLYQFLKKNHGSIYLLVYFSLILFLHLSRFAIFFIIYPICVYTRFMEKIKFGWKGHFVEVQTIISLMLDKMNLYNISSPYDNVTGK
ncbi:MAG: glycosyltransferase family 2 protein [Bacteroidetes bacterium]|nr:glycosyltransferase family 2 protein [Bacteroidota bacterium]